MKISLVKGNFDILCPGVALGLRSCKKQQPAIPSYSNAKLKSGVFFNQKNKWNSSVNSNFENFEFWVLSILKFGLFGTMFPQFQKLRPVSETVFTLDLRFSYKKIFSSLSRNPIFKPSEAQCYPWAQNIQISFYQAYFHAKI